MALSLSPLACACAAMVVTATSRAAAAQTTPCLPYSRANAVAARLRRRPPASHARCTGAPPRRARRRAPFPDPPPPELATPLASPHPGEAPRSPRPTNFAGTKVVAGACMATTPALVEPLPPPHPEPNQLRSKLLHLTLVLPDPSTTAPSHRSDTAPSSHRRRPPASVDRPPQTTSAPTETTGRCARAPSPFSPTSPSPPGPNLAGNGAVRPSPILSSSRDLGLKEMKVQGLE